MNKSPKYIKIRVFLCCVMRNSMSHLIIGPSEIPMQPRMLPTLSSASIRCVLFDLGGVVFDSPISFVREFEIIKGYKKDSINRAFSRSKNWKKLEEGKIGQDEFCERMILEGLLSKGVTVSDLRQIMRGISSVMRPRKDMMLALGILRSNGLKVGAVTNNWREMSSSAGMHGKWRDAFDVIVESAIEGVRKPNPQIFKIACERVQCDPKECIFLDDIGINLKSARSLGMKTIKVKASDTRGLNALRELASLVGFDLLPRNKRKSSGSQQIMGSAAKNLPLFQQEYQKRYDNSKSSEDEVILASKL